MSKKLFIAAVFCMYIFSTAIHPAFAQSRSRLGVLPFAGGAEGDGETVATLLSFQSDIQAAFTVVPRTSAVNALIAEQNFQMSGYTDSDTIAGIGRMLNADFVVSGHIHRLGNWNIIIATIVNVESFEQLAGVHREYRAIEEVPAYLPDMARRLIEATKRDTSMLPKLAVAPFNIATGGVNEQEAEALAQILAAEIVNTGKYAVLPRTTTMQAAQKELEFQMQGYTSEEEAKALGRAINAELLLSAEVRSLGNMTMFTAQILNVEDGSLLAGDNRNYRELDEGLRLMADLALLLTDRTDAAARIRAREKEAARAKTFGHPAKLWSAGASLGSALNIPWLIGTIRGTAAPLPYMFAELGVDLGFISAESDLNHISVFPYVHAAFYYPVSAWMGAYAGAGGGYLIANNKFKEEGPVKTTVFAADFFAGATFLDMIDVSYTFRTDFKMKSSKVSLGYFYRFK